VAARDEQPQPSVRDLPSCAPRETQAVQDQSPALGGSHSTTHMPPDLWSGAGGSPRSGRVGLRRGADCCGETPALTYTTPVSAHPCIRSASRVPARPLPFFRGPRRALLTFSQARHLTRLLSVLRSVGVAYIEASHPGERWASLGVRSPATRMSTIAAVAAYLAPARHRPPLSARGGLPGCLRRDVAVGVHGMLERGDQQDHRGQTTTAVPDADHPGGPVPWHAVRRPPAALTPRPPARCDINHPPLSGNKPSSLLFDESCWQRLNHVFKPGRSLASGSGCILPVAGNHGHRLTTITAATYPRSPSSTTPFLPGHAGHAGHF